MKYLEALGYLHSLDNLEKINTYAYKEALNLKRFRGFLVNIGSPQKSLKCIHVAGSKGKGSTCAFITYILREAGYKVGLYTSPHLCDFRERIRILGHKSQVTSQKSGCDFEGMISRQAVARIISRLKPEIEKYNNSSIHGKITYFEACTALAFLYFKEQKVGFAVLETGLGGRLDATNTVDAFVSVITPISYEHMDKLGKSLKKIAGEKAGIIRSHKLQVSSHKYVVISARQEKEAAEVIRERCRKAHSRLHEVSSCDSSGLKINLLGRHQKENAALAVAVVRALDGYGLKISGNVIQKGLLATRWPGRCEVISKKPLIVLDGAQNAASAEVIGNAVKDNFKYSKLILVLGMSSDKDIRGICSKLYELADKVVLTKADNPRAQDPALIRKYFQGKEIFVTGSVPQAKIKALSLAGKRDLILATGSLFVAGEFKSGKKRYC